MAILDCRVLEKCKCEVSQQYKGSRHNGIDLVGGGYTLDNVVAHSDGVVVGVVNNCNRNTSKTGEKIYGNYVKIKHDNGMYTFYSHLKYGTVAVKLNQRVTKGTVLGYMGNTGYSFGAHLHFEVRNENNVQIDPTPYIMSDLPTKEVDNTYKTGTTYTTQVNLKVREGAGIDKAWKKTNQLTKDGQAHALNQEYATLKAGTRVTVQETQKIEEDIWLRIPSGWIAGYYDKKEYVK